MKISVREQRRTVEVIRLIGDILGPSCSIDKILEILRSQEGTPPGREPIQSRVS